MKTAIVLLMMMSAQATQPKTEKQVQAEYQKKVDALKQMKAEVDKERMQAAEQAQQPSRKTK